jgi:hypothetical protein
MCGDGRDWLLIGWLGTGNGYWHGTRLRSKLGAIYRARGKKQDVECGASFAAPG